MRISKWATYSGKGFLPCSDSFFGFKVAYFLSRWICLYGFRTYSSCCL